MRYISGRHRCERLSIAKNTLAIHCVSLAAAVKEMWRVHPEEELEADETILDLAEQYGDHGVCCTDNVTEESEEETVSSISSIL